MRLLAVTLLLSLFFGCKDEETFVPINPKAAFTYKVSTDNPYEVKFVSTITDRDSLRWDFGDGETSTLAHPSHVYAEVGTYALSLTAYGEPGSTPTVVDSTLTIVIPEPTAEFTYAPTENDLALKFTANTTYAKSFAWDFGDGGTSASKNPTHEYSAAGSYTVTLTVTGFEGTTPVTVTQTVLAGATYDLGLIDQANWIVQVGQEAGGIETTITANAINFKGEGAWKGDHIYQQVTVEAGTYQLSGTVTVNSVIADTWSELIFSDQEPVEGVDYKPGIPYQVVYSTWNGSPQDPGTYDLADANAGGEYPVDGLYTFDAPQTFYIVIKSGSGTAYDLTWTDLSFKKVVDHGLISMSNWMVQVGQEAGGIETTITENDINFKGEGAWKGDHIYQQVTVGPGTYQLTGTITVNSVVADTWSELIFSDQEPVEGVDYKPGIPYQVVYSTWNSSPTDPGTYSLADANKGGEYPVDGLYTFDTAETFFIVIKSGSGAPYDLTWNDLAFVLVE